MSKYEPLWKYLKENEKDTYKLSYDEIKDILGFDIDHSFLTYKKEVRKYGYEVSKISMKEKVVIFSKIVEHIHSIILIKKGDKYLNYYDERWGIYLFPNIKGNDIEMIKKQYNTDNVKLLFDKIHDKYAIPHQEIRTYHHYFYEVNTEVQGEYFSLKELLNHNKIKEHNEDIIQYIQEYDKDRLAKS